jgi:uncharacterized protein YaeQ
MALKATIFKADLQIADMDRSYYGDHALTLARHPSETDERMMLRLLAFALNAGEALTFGKGLSADEEPDLWRHDLTGGIELWVEVGLPDERRLRKACGRAAQVRVYAYGGHAADLWWKQNAADLGRNANLAVLGVPREASQALAQLAQRTMKLQVTVQEGQLWVGDDSRSVALELAPWKDAAAPAR